MCHVCHPTSTSGPRSALHTALATRGLSPSSARGGRKKLRMEGGCDRHVGVRGGVCAPPPASPAVLVPFSPLWPERRDHRCCGMQPRGRGRRRLAPSPRASTRRCALAHTNACARSQPQPKAAMPTVSTNLDATMTTARRTTSRAPCAAPPGAEAASPRPRARDRPPRALVRSFVRSVGRSVGRADRAVGRSGRGSRMVGPIGPTARSPDRMSVRPSVRLSVRPSVRPSVRSSVCVSVTLINFKEILWSYQLSANIRALLLINPTIYLNPSMIYPSIFYLYYISFHLSMISGDPLYHRRR